MKLLTDSIRRYKKYIVIEVPRAEKLPTDDMWGCTATERIIQEPPVPIPEEELPPILIETLLQLPTPHTSTSPTTTIA